MLWILIALAVGLSLLSLRGEAARERYYREQLAALPHAPAPPATVIVPVKGRDEGLAENLTSLATLDYPDYELIVVARSEADLMREAVPARAKVVIAGEGNPDTGEKINNLLAAVRAARLESEIFAFADSDGRAPARWLRALSASLAQEGAGAATGYRWHLPYPADFWSLLRSVWNAVIAGGMGSGGASFAWGGAMAIRRDTFSRLDVPAWWRSAVSDDYRLTQAVKAAGLRVVFAPGAMVAAVDHTGGVEFLGWIRRQLQITRFYAPKLWVIALIAHVVYCGAMVAALAVHTPLAMAALAIQLGVGWWKGARRIALARLAMPEHEAWFSEYAALHVALVPVGTWLWLYAAAGAALSGTVHWRGYKLELHRIPPP